MNYLYDDWEEENRPRRRDGKTSVLKGILVVTVIISVLLMFAGGIFMFLQSPLNNEAEDSGDIKTASWLDFTGRIIFWFGAAVLSGIMIIGGVLMKELDPAVRFGMLFLAGLMLIGTGLAI